MFRDVLAQPMANKRRNAMNRIIAFVFVVLAIFAFAVPVVAEEKDLPPEIQAVEYLYGAMDWTRSAEEPTAAEKRFVSAIACPNDGNTYFLKGQYGSGASCSDIKHEKFTSGGGTNVTVVLVLGNARIALTTLADGTAMISWSTSNGAGVSTLQSQSPDAWLRADTSTGFNVIEAMTSEWREFLGIRTYGKLSAPPVTCNSSTLSWSYFNTTVGEPCTCSDSGTPAWSC